jgi:hypothetical protein
METATSKLEKAEATVARQDEALRRWALDLRAVADGKLPPDANLARWLRATAADMAALAAYPANPDPVGPPYPCPEDGPHCDGVMVTPPPSSEYGPYPRPAVSPPIDTTDVHVLNLIEDVRAHGMCPSAESCPHPNPDDSDCAGCLASWAALDALSSLVHPAADSSAADGAAR